MKYRLVVKNDFQKIFCNEKIFLFSFDGPASKVAPVSAFSRISIVHQKIIPRPSQTKTRKALAEGQKNLLKCLANPLDCVTTLEKYIMPISTLEAISLRKISEEQIRGPTPASFFVYFPSFSNKQYNFYNKSM